VAVCVLAPVVEVLVLWAAGMAGSRALAVQVSAPSPWGEFHDLRWLLVLHDSWLTLALECAGIWAVRSLLDALIIVAAWPDPDRPSVRRQLRRTIPFTLGASLVLLPWTVVAFEVSVIPISWLVFVALPPVVILALVMHHGSVTGAWWHQTPPWRGVAWVAGTFLIETVVGMMLGAAPAALWVPLAGLGGLLNAWAWRGLVTAVLDRGTHRRWVPLGPTVIVVMLVTAIIGTSAGFAIVGGRAHPAPVAGTPPDGGGGPPVLIVSGFNSKLTGPEPAPIPGPYDEVRFSYAGVDALGRPVPYSAAQTHRSLPDLVRLLVDQVSLLRRRAGRPVTIVAESEGSLVARVYMAAVRRPPVARVVLLSPLDQPGRVFYPPSGHQGYGVATGEALGGLTDLLGHISPIELGADDPLFRSIVDHAGGLRGLLACPLPGTPENLIEPLADAVADPVGLSKTVPVTVVSAFHGGLLTDRLAEQDVARLIAGKTITSGTALLGTEQILRLAGGAWQVPSLPLHLYTGSDDKPTCEAMDARLRQWVGPGAGPPGPPPGYGIQTVGTAHP
jgi:hypothetical protein